MPKILFYAERDLHLQFLEPIHDALKAFKGYETFFSAPTYNPSTETIPGTGLSPKQIQRLESKSTFISDVNSFNFNWAIVADNCHDKLIHIKNIINIGHGLICKGLYYTDKPEVRKENLSRLVCVPGPWHKSRLANQIFCPIEITGFIKSDLLFGPKACQKQEFCLEKNIPSEHRIILFAPTYNKELNCLDQVGKKIAKVADSQTTLLIKLHNMTDPTWRDYYAQLAVENENIILLSDEDYSGMMQAADLMISDVSSIFIEFMLLDKPVILVNNPDQKKYMRYDPTDIEYMVRDATYELNDSTEIFNVIDYALEHPEEKSNDRKKYIQEIDCFCDGKSALRAAQAIVDTIENNNPRLELKEPQITLLIDCLGTNRKLVQDSISQLKEYVLQADNKLLLLSDENLNIDIKEIESITIDDLHARLNDILQKYASPYIVCLKCGYMLPPNWLRHLWLHMKWNQDIQAVKTIADPIILEQYFDRIYPDQDIENFDIYTIQKMVLFASIGQSISNVNVSSAALITKDEFLKDLLQNSRSLNNSSKNFIFEYLNEQFSDQKSIYAMDLYFHPMNTPIISTQKLLAKAERLIAKGKYHEAQDLLNSINY